MATARMDLGFVNDDCDARLLQSHYFPSKVGGKPAWLSLNPIPKTEQLSCPRCNNPLVFLLQVYSPRDKTEEDAFHRTLFLFVCRNSACSTPNDASNFKVFRSQLPRMNQFFSSDPPPDDPADEIGPAPSAQKYQPLCEVCGCIGPKQCSQCKSVSYCCKDHQTLHWKAGHKTACGKHVSHDSGNVQ